MNSKNKGTIYPTILTDSLSAVREKVSLLQGIDQVEVVQIDVVDGQFVDNVTVTPVDLAELDFGDLKLDIHLLVEEPLDYAYESRDVEKHLPIRSLIAQVERMSSQEDFIRFCQQQEWQVGLALDLWTPIESIEKVLLKELDVVLLMSTEAGFQGKYSFSPIALEKIQLMREIKTTQGYDFEIMVDGGIKVDNAQEVIKAGADSLVVGSALWQAENLKETIAQFQGKIESQL